MKKILRALLILIVGLASTLAIITIIKQNDKLKRLEEVSKEAPLSKENYDTAQLNQSQEINRLKKENQDLEIQIQELTEKTKEMKELSVYKENFIENLKREVDSYVARVKLDKGYNTKDYDPVIDYKEIEVGDMIEGMEVTKVEKQGSQAHFAFDGYYILKGVIYKDMLGLSSFTFEPDKDEAKRVFNHTIDFGELKLSFKTFGINEDEILKQGLGEEVYNRFETLFAERIDQEVEIIGIFKGYSTKEKVGSIYVNTAELVRILEVVEVTERPME